MAEEFWRGFLGEQMLIFSPSFFLSMSLNFLSEPQWFTLSTVPSVRKGSRLCSDSGMSREGGAQRLTGSHEAQSQAFTLAGVTLKSCPEFPIPTHLKFLFSADAALTTWCAHCDIVFASTIRLSLNWSPSE